MAIVDMLTMLTHTSGQVLTTVVQGGEGGIGAMARAVGAAAAATANLGSVFMTAFLKGIS